MTRELPYGNLTPDLQLFLALDAAIRLRCECTDVTTTGFTASLRNTAIRVEYRATPEHGLLSSSEGGDPEAESAGRFAGEFADSIAEISAGITDERLDEISGNMLAEFPQLCVTMAPDEGPRRTGGARSTAWSFLIPQDGYFVTPVLVMLNALVFVLMVASGTNWLSPSSDDLLFWGANLRSLTLNGELWRLLACTFIHIGVIHLLMNMYALIQIGVQVEWVLGTRRFMAAYILSGIAASLTSIAVHPITVSAGASGAVFGMFGVVLALLTSDLIDSSVRKPMLTNIGIFVVFNLVYGMKEGIDNSAHVGGLVTGFLIGYIYLPGLKSGTAGGNHDRSIGYAAGVVGLLCTLVYVYIPRQILDYTSGMKRLMRHEQNALQILTRADGTSQESVLHAVESTAKDEWDQGLMLADSLDQLDIPEPAHARLKYIKDYTSLRLESCDLISKSMRENTHAYDSLLEEKSKRMSEILEKLGESGAE